MDAKAEKLAQARRKLREYQSKHQNRAAFTNDGSNWSSSPHQANSTGRRSVSSIREFCFDYYYYYYYYYYIM
ncbi:unnamed protein product [Anisakis simplex]|uniref:Uncharacterized protein n=1 Tax=Anisakis simplex TaxID=6269 RepID=A0A0M3J9L7_ANISI|nr:unnamed protein product [Anisakis simplex]